jgi:HPt (histidine-containing phosphotransfer) domain-containing protein
MNRLRACHQAGDYDEARRIAHSLKGAAGALGIIEVQRLAAELEGMLREHAAAEAIYSLAEIAGAAQTSMDAAIHVALDGDSAPEPASQIIDRRGIDKAIGDLDRLLDTDDIAAQDAFREAAPLLAPALGDDVVANMRRHIERFEFAPAMAMLRVAADTWRKTP